jgi:hypothetical protein
MFDKQVLQSDDLLLFEQYRLSNLLSSFDSFTEEIDEEFESISLFFFRIAYSFDGIIVFVILTICTCGYMRRVPRLREWFLSENKGFAGIFYKGLFAFCSYRLLSLLF